MRIQFIAKRSNYSFILVLVGGTKMSIAKFFSNVSSEMRKVSWPKRKELVNYTITVIGTVVFLTVFFVIVDFGVSNLVKWILSLNQ